MAQYQHVIFDFDGVLCDSLHQAIKVFNELRPFFPSLPCVATQEDMVEVYGGSLKTCLRTWLGESEHQEFFRRHSATMATLSSELALFPHVPKLINSLPAGTASIVTSAYSDHVRTVLEKATSYVDSTRFYSIAGKETHKDKTEKILSISSLLGISVDECVYVGDLESDLLYCRDVPIDMVAVSYGYHPRWHLETLSPDYLVDSVVELEEIILAQVIAKRFA